ncbi:response regulator transcription factor [Thalassobacillus devorans]|uniref:response regulator transcription factor n=1 Tax=Thalassobacillus devorans TaxID=279813 RepID=UPI00048E5E94|nr:response regulator transcription factor [Thalassobacillus devorans]
MKRIFIVEDDLQITSFLSESLAGKGFQLFAAQEYDRIAEEFVAYEPHLVLMTVGSAKFDGLYWSRQLRKKSKCPILLIAEADSDMNQVKAIENGADDYLETPLNSNLLDTKISRVMRRVYKDDHHGLNLSEISPELKLRPMEILYKEKRQSLTRNEFFLMKAFLQYPDQLLPREQLLHLLTKDIGDMDDNTLSVNINRLRKKLSNIGLANVIKTIRGKGYKFLPMG